MDLDIAFTILGFIATFIFRPYMDTVCILYFASICHDMDSVATACEFVCEPIRPGADPALNGRIFSDYTEAIIPPQ